jgi:prepilin-type processing-associated H-X9-DG protein
VKLNKHKWQLVPKNAKQFDSLTKGEYSQLNLLLINATLVAHSEEILNLPAEDLRTESQRALKLIAMAALQFSLENDEKFAFDASNVYEKLKPFLRNEKLLQDPKTGKAFALNAQVANTELIKIQHPAQTVLFYTGKNGQLAYDANGKALVAFADGHVKAVSREQAAKLRWNP